jgi:large subunit ribosomal protein L18
MRHGQSRKDARAARHVRIRRKIQGTADRPRMAISFSNKHTNVQFINDDEQRTLIGATTQGGDFGQGIAGAEALGKLVAEKATGAGIKAAIVDRGGFRYHGRLKAIVESANRAGLAVGALSKSEPASSDADNNDVEA